jgi:hypothetical protein
MDINPYASPQATTTVRFGPDHEGMGPWHRGKLLVVGHDTQLPSRCVKCNAPTEQPLKRYRLSWHSPLAYLVLLILGPLPYIILALMVRKKMTVHVGIRDYHRFHRTLGILIGVFGTLAGFGLIMVGGISGTGLLALLGILLIPISLVISVLKTRIVWPKRIDKQFARLHGVCPEYLAELSEFSF